MSRAQERSDALVSQVAAVPRPLRLLHRKAPKSASVYGLTKFGLLVKSLTPRKPDSRANSGVISGNPIGLIESTSIVPSPMRYRARTLTRGRVHILTQQVISPRRTPSRSRL